MIIISCKGCYNNCCKHPYLTPILLPSEEKEFEKYSRVIETPFEKIRLLQKKENGSCIFLEDKTLRCTIYEKRPLECQIYPFLLDFSNEKVNVKLDKRYCPHLKTLKFDKEELESFVNKEKLSREWIESYKFLLKEGKY